MGSRGCDEVKVDETVNVCQLLFPNVVTNADFMVLLESTKTTTVTTTATTVKTVTTATTTTTLKHAKIKALKERE